MLKMIEITTKEKQFQIPEGRPVIITWKGKNKSRSGMSTAVGWIKHGEAPKTVKLVHSCFETWDKIEQEYQSSWTIWHSQIIDIRPLTAKG